ncbi:MAG TPA: putative toxin-antitoxin system toxin component, PIN family [Puia sp.]|nr:putative toxin-antitoxin system toxin component, PIN family [Puia sp.]
MRVVLDTNILLQSLPRKSKVRPIWDAFLKKDIQVILTPSILLEYEEIIGARTSAQVSANVISLFYEAENSIFIHIYYEWNIITDDPDDNKFFDAAVAGNADYIVTNDNHFKQASKIEFPKINIINADQFLVIIQNHDY